MWMHLGKTLFLLLFQAQVHSKHLSSPSCYHRGSHTASLVRQWAVQGGRLQSVHSNFSLPLHPSHSFPLLQCDSTWAAGSICSAMEYLLFLFFSSSSNLGGISRAPALSSEATPAAHHYQNFAIYTQGTGRDFLCNKEERRCPIKSSSGLSEVFCPTSRVSR